MSLQLGPALRSGAGTVASRTGAILLGAYVALTVALLPLSNTMIVRLYERIGLTEATGAIPLVLDVPLSVAVGGYLVGILVGSYLAIVAIRTFVSGDGSAFPEGAFTRNVPLAIANVVVGGLVYGLLMAVGFALLVVPGLLVYIAFLFMLPYVACEDRNFVDALRSSYRLSRGNWLMLGVLVLVVFGVAGVVGVVGGFLSGLLLPPALGQLSTAFVQSPVSLFSLAVIAAAFEQLRDEGDDATGSEPTSASSQTPA